MKRTSDKQRPIDRLRDSAGSLKINTSDDETPIREMISTGDRLLVVKDHGIYEIALADQIDPERSNPSVPNTIQRVLPFGAADSWVGAVVLTARQLFMSSCFDADAGRRAFDLVLRIAQDIAGAQQIIRRHNELESEALGSVDPQIHHDRSFVLPSVGNVEASCNEYLQRTDHALRELFKTVQLFYPDVGSGGWDSLKKKIESGPEGLDNFSQFLADSIGFLKLIRNARNCVEHPRPEQRLVVVDFSIDRNNMLVPPTIEVIYPKDSMPKSQVAEFFDSSIKSLVNVVELMVVFLGARNVGQAAGFPVHVMELAPDQRRHPHVRYSFGMLMGGQLVPMS
ncbi:MULTISPECIES: hypothetical protein [Halomonadaceae]|uniref:Uncharacterized protein n=2 Tax=Vreelandella TaxID=3137766 RepID=A0A7Z0RY57_9GAMM|nr:MULTISPECIES: hypothetical protein [Halomonas]NYS77867.1 hypothetical protein [Halomonas glaciei]|tara:strand:+ start:253 stop:1269 length:1017 start_codon:yes stop_codon:yes gene_type:complete